MGRRVEPDDEPVGQEAKVLLAIGTKGKVQADLAATFGVSVIGNYIKRLKGRGLVRVGGTVKRYRAPDSKMIVPTSKGKEMLKRLQ